MYEFTEKIGNFTIQAPSRRKNKKYDVLDNNNRYLFSFGDNRYQHYKDQFGYYKDLDHLDPDRRKNYRLRHKNDYIDDPNYAGFWSYNFLW